MIVQRIVVRINRLYAAMSYLRDIATSLSCVSLSVIRMKAIKSIIAATMNVTEWALTS